MTAEIGHPNVEAELSAFPASARWNCQSPSHSIPHAARTTNTCKASHLGVTRKSHRGAGRTLDMPKSLAPRTYRPAGRPRPGPGRAPAGPYSAVTTPGDPRGRP